MITNGKKYATNLVELHEGLGEQLKHARLLQILPELLLLCVLRDLGGGAHCSAVLGVF